MQSQVENARDQIIAAVKLVSTTPAVLTSGAIVPGLTYTITNYAAGDDFKNVGAQSNATGIIFFATGTTPTVWTNGSTLTSSPFRTTIQGQNVFPDFKDIEAIKGSLPAASVMVWDEAMKAADTRRQSWDSDASIELLGYTTLDKKEDLVHDLKRVAGSLAILYCNQSSGAKWWIPKPEIQCRRDVMDGSNLCWVSISFKIHVIMQDTVM